MYHHIVVKIEVLLNMSNNRLSDIFDRSGTTLRKELEECKSKGEIFIGVEGCEGFDPVKGCPGHPSEFKHTEVKSSISDIQFVRSVTTKELE